MPIPQASAFPTDGPAPAPSAARLLVCGDDPGAAFPHAQRIALDPAAVSHLADGSVDSIVALDGLGAAIDPIQTLRAWRRVLREDGTLVFATAPGATDRASSSPSFLRSLLQLVGGFEVLTDAPAEPLSASLVFARRGIAEIRTPLASLGPCLAAAAAASVAGRCELLFQTGVVLLQCGEAELARACFERMLRCAPGSAEGHFGLGMAYAGEERWREALCEFECARRLDPHNPELQRWLEIARRQLGAPAVVLPAGCPAKWSPACAPSAGLRL